MQESTYERAVRTTAAELTKAHINFRINESGGVGQQSPEYNLLPTGVGASRVLMAGTVLEIETVKHQPKTIKARIADVTGTYFTYAADHNQQARGTLETLQPDDSRTQLAPDELTHAVIIGKPNTYTASDGKTYTSVDPEYIIPATKRTRNSQEDAILEATISRFEDLENGAAPLGTEALDGYNIDYEELQDTLVTGTRKLKDAVPSRSVKREEGTLPPSPSRIRS